MAAPEPLADVGELARPPRREPPAAGALLAEPPLQLRYHPMEGTYLAEPDCRQLPLPRPAGDFFAAAPRGRWTGTQPVVHRLAPRHEIGHRG